MDTFTVTQADYAIASTQSSIIKPRFRDDDIWFSTMGIYEKDDLQPFVGSSVRYTLPGSNMRLFIISSYFQALFYTFLRYLLLVFFTLYKYYILVASSFKKQSALFYGFIWYTLKLLPLPEQVFKFVLDPEKNIVSSYPINKRESGSNSNSIDSRIYYIYKYLRMLPTKVRKIILRKFLSSVVPRNRQDIRQATASLYIPKHITFIFEMNPLVVSQPAEIPYPYINYDKKIIIPPKKLIFNAIAKRAEWASLNHTHKAAETFRVIYEAAKCISWAAITGVRIVTIFESNGYCWNDMPKLCKVIDEELNSLTDESYQVFDYIKLVNLETGMVMNIKKVPSDTSTIPSSEFMKTNAENINKNTLSMESFVSSSSKISFLTSAKEQSHTFETNLTVFFMSNKNTDIKKVWKYQIKQDVASCLNIKIPTSCEEEDIYYPMNPYYTKDYNHPELIMKFCTYKQNPFSFAGYHLESSQVHFARGSEYANFKTFVEGLTELHLKLGKNR